MDLSVDRVEPAGSAAPGQCVTGSTKEFGRRWRIEARIEEVDPSRHVIAFRTTLPFGVTGLNRISCDPSGVERTLVRFG